MTMSTIMVDYHARIVALHTAAAQLRLGQMIALGVMIVALVVVALLGFLAIARKTVRLPIALIPIPLAIYSGSLCKRRNRALLQSLRLRSYYERAVDRLEGKWRGTGPNGEEFARPVQSYLSDLDVIGHGSLFQLLCTCRTQTGQKRLAEYLLEVANPDEILERQEAVQELEKETELRERISLIGEYSFQEGGWETVVEWLESPREIAYRAFQVAAAISSLALAALLLLGFASRIAWAQLSVPVGILLILNGVFGWCYRTRVLNSADAIRSLDLEVGMLREGLELLRSRHFTSTLLSRLKDVASENKVSAHLRRLERLSRIMTERNKEWFYAFSRVVLVGTQTFLLIEQWRFQHGRSLRRWLDAWSEFEALMALANYAHEHPENTFPQIVRDQVTFVAKSLGHPLMPVDKCVRNDIALNAQNRFYVISGSNMAGKSTLLRSIGLNAVLAYAGAPVVAGDLSIARFTICASLGVQDSLLDGKSKFFAEIDRLKQALVVPRDERPVLFLIDEMLAGTNSIDRKAIAEAFVKTMMEQGAVGALSTHDLALTNLASFSGMHGTNVHMASADDADPLNFDYILKPGATTQSSALAIATLAGLVLAS